MIRVPSTSAEFFESKYLQQADPWRFSTDPYEQSRYSATIELLDRRTFDYGVEPGCSIGVLTAELGTVCHQLYAFDFSPTAVAQATSRCAHLRNVRIDCRALDEQISIGTPDLVVLSEIGYYFSAAQLNLILSNLVSQMLPKSTLLAAHWLGRSEDHVISGDDVHQVLMDKQELNHVRGCRFAEFRLDMWMCKA